MINAIRKNKTSQLVISLFIGIIFGFLLHKGGVTHYDVIIGQLLWEDFTVVKIMLSAVITGMIGIYFLKGKGLVTLHPKYGSLGTSIIGGLLFGIGFGLLGLCPGTLAGAIGHGDLSALIGGLSGIIIGSMLFASSFPWLNKRILTKGSFGEKTIPEVLGCNSWIVVCGAVSIMILLLVWIEKTGF